MKRIRLLSVLLFVLSVLCISSYAAITFYGIPTPLNSPVNGEYGRLIWRQDFENPDSIGDYYFDPSYDSPYDTSDSVYIGNPMYVHTGDGDGTAPTFAVVPRPDGNGHCLSMTGHTTYPIYKLNFGGDLLSSPGVYTLVIHAMNDGEALIANCRFNMNRCFSGAPVIGHFDAPSGHFGTSAYSFTVCTREEFDASGLAESAYTVKNVYAFQYAYLFLTNGIDRTCFLDDLELWYEPYADITFVISAPDPYSEKALTEVFPIRHRSFRPGTLLPKLTIPGSPLEFVCWSQTPDDASHPVETAAAGTQTLYAVFREREGGALSENLSVYEAVITLARLRADRYRDASFPADAGYKESLAYLEAHDALPSVPLDSCEADILRADFAGMLYQVLPDYEMQPVCFIDALPDVFPYDPYFDAVLSLYRCGILSGHDEYGTFDPLLPLSREDYALYMTRVNGLHEAPDILPMPTPSDMMVLDAAPHGSFDAHFISAPVSYLSTLEPMPAAALPMGSFLMTSVTRSHIRRDFSVNKQVASAYIEFQSDNPFDLYLNGVLIPESEDANGWHVTGRTDVASVLRTGMNRLAVRGYTADEPTNAVCALRGGLLVTYTDGTRMKVLTDSSFRNGTVCDFWEGTEPEGWQTAAIPSDYTAVPSYAVHPRLLRRSCYFRKNFETEKKVAKATLFATAKGMYVPYLNGIRLTDGRFLPGSMTGVTEYQTYDVTDLMQTGVNVLGALTGNGFYNCSSWGTLEAKVPAVLMQLEIEYADGSRQTVVTDGTWRVTASPVYDNDLQFGERYDARLEIDGWCTSSVNDSDWQTVETVSFGTLSFLPESYEPVRVTKIDRARRIGTVLGGEYVLYDFGTNEAGRVSLTLHNTVKGERIVIRYCEVLVDDTPAVGAYGDVYFEADNKADAISPYGGRNIDVYICRGAETETYTPEFTYTGFRYIYIKGYSGRYDYTTVRRAVMHNDLAQTGDFFTEDEDLAEIWDAVKRSYRSNLVGGATDCPTREKNFWNGDIQMFVSTACRYMDNNALLSRWTMYGKKLQYDVYGWEDEEYIVPLALYRYYGNTAVLEAKYPKILSLMNKRRAQLTDGELLPTDRSPYCDHGAWQNVPADYYAAAFWCRMYRDTAEIASILGKEDDASRFLSEFEASRAAFNDKYYDASAHDYAPHNQSAVVLALAFGIAPEEDREALTATLHSYVVEAKYHLTCGFTSAEYVLGLLCDYGYFDDAYQILKSTDTPSLLGMIRSHGGGTTTEGWGGFSGADGGGSLNHFAIGGISRFFFEYLGGIKIVRAGFEEIAVKPYFDEAVGGCETPYESDFGHISSAWRYDAAKDAFTWRVTVPHGVTAHCSLTDGFAFLNNGVLLPSDTSYTVTDGTFTAEVVRVPKAVREADNLCVIHVPHGADTFAAQFDPDGRLLSVTQFTDDSVSLTPNPSAVRVTFYFLSSDTHRILAPSLDLPSDTP